MARYLDPKNDLTFKRVFGEHKYLCISLLNSLLPLDKPIVNIEYQMDKLPSELEIFRLSVLDVRCTDSGGRQFLVEILIHWSEIFMGRFVQINDSKPYVMHSDKVKKYEFLQPVYSLNFINEIFEESPEMRDE